MKEHEDVEDTAHEHQLHEVHAEAVRQEGHEASVPKKPPPKMKEVDDDGEEEVKKVKGKGKGKEKSSKKPEEKEEMMDEDEENQSPVKPAPKKNGVIDDSDED